MANVELALLCDIWPKSTESAYFAQLNEYRVVITFSVELVLSLVVLVFPLLLSLICICRNVKATVAKCNYTRQVVAAQTLPSGYLATSLDQLSIVDSYK